MRASLVIAAHNEGNSLAKTIASCSESCAGLDCEIVIADDASDDGSIEAAEKQFPRVRVVRSDVRQGASPAKALGGANARGETLVFLDGHTKPESGAILRLVENVELLQGEAIFTPAVPALDTKRWKNAASQIGRGYTLDLEKFGCGWCELSQMREVKVRRRRFHESPALIGCALAVARELYDELWGFDPHMRIWGVEDLDFGLKCWLMGRRILHDSEAVVGHRFRARFDNYTVPIEHVVANQLRMARKNFTRAVWSDWVDRCRGRHSGRLAEHPEGLWARVWSLFEADQASVEAERAHLHAHRVRDEFWFAERFGLTWPKLHVTPGRAFAALEEPEPSTGPSASPSPPPCPTITFTPNPLKLGFTNPASSSELRQWVYVKVDPPESAASVTVEITGQPRATIIAVDTQNYAAGLIRAYVKGVQATPSNKPDGDTWLEAKVGGKTCGKLPIIVVIPKAIGTPHPHPSGAVMGVNLRADAATSPAWWEPLDPTKVVLVTVYRQWLKIPVIDQFGDPLDSVYTDVPVEEEFVPGDWRKINQNMSADGTYLDPVGRFMLRGGSVANATVDRDSGAANVWPSKPKIPLVADSQVQNIAVRVVGHELSPGVVNRTWSTTLPKNVAIVWPD